MVGYREKPNLRNAHRAVVWPSSDASDPIGNLVVYRERGTYLAQHPSDTDTFARVNPVNNGNKGGFVCTSLEQAERLGYRQES